MAKSGELRKEMEKAISFLAIRQLGLGTDVDKTKKAMDAVTKWKSYFVHYMQHQPDRDLVETEVSRLFKIELDTLKSTGKINPKYFTDKPRTLGSSRMSCVDDIKDMIRATLDTKKFAMGKEKASFIADSIIQKILNEEVAAIEEGITPYYSRDPGPVEFGEITFPVPQFAEIPTGEFYNALEDEDATSWSLPEIHYCDDEIVEVHENEVGTFIEDVLKFWEDTHTKTVELRDAIEQANFQERGFVLRRAWNCMKIKAITWDQYCYLWFFATEWLVWKMRQNLQISL